MQCSTDHKRPYTWAFVGVDLQRSPAVQPSHTRSWEATNPLTLLSCLCKYPTGHANGRISSFKSRRSGRLYLENRRFLDRTPADCFHLGPPWPYQEAVGEPDDRAVFFLEDPAARSGALAPCRLRMRAWVSLVSDTQEHGESVAMQSAPASCWLSCSDSGSPGLWTSV